MPGSNRALHRAHLSCAAGWEHGPPRRRSNVFAGVGARYLFTLVRCLRRRDYVQLSARSQWIVGYDRHTLNNSHIF